MEGEGKGDRSLRKEGGVRQKEWGGKGKRRTEGGLRRVGWHKRGGWEKLFQGRTWQKKG